MSTDDISREIEEIIAELSLPVTAAEDAAGWTPQSKEAALKYFFGMRTSLVSGTAIPPLGVARALDHWGVVGGELLEKIAKLTNKLRRQHAN